MSQQFEFCKPLSKRITAVCHQINIHIVFHALIDSLAALIVTHMHEDADILIEEATKMLMTRVKDYQSIKSTKRVRRKRKETLH